MIDEKKQGLAVIEESTALTVLTVGLDDLLQGVRERVQSDVSDISQKKGRDEVVSNAFKVTKTKTYISGKIDDLITAKKAEIQPTLEIIEVLKGNKKKSNLELSKLTEDTRSVVTEWEEEEKERVAKAVELKAAEELEKEKGNCQELANLLDEKFDANLKVEADRLEAERKLEEAKVESDRVEKENEIKKLAAEKATREAEELAKAELEKVEREKQEAIDREAKAKEATAQAERDKIAAQERAKIQEEESAKQRIADKEKADRDAEIAVEKARQAEIDRQAAEKEKEAADTKAREDNNRHASKIMRAAKEGLMLSGIDEATAKKIVKAIKKGEVPNVTIIF